MTTLRALAALSRRLFDCGVLPYYLHQLDRVPGAAHFAVSDARALELHARACNALLPGYLVPRLVREMPGPAKMPWSGNRNLLPDGVRDTAPGKARLWPGSHNPPAGSVALCRMTRETERVRIRRSSSGRRQQCP